MDSFHISRYDRQILVTTESAGKMNTKDGLYVVNLNKGNFKAINIGSYSGIKKFNNGYIVLDRLRNSIIFLNFRLKKVYEVFISDEINNSDLHGLDVSNDGYLYIVATRKDKVFIYNIYTMQKEGEISLGSGINNDQHHINDICVTNEDIYLSMFSIKGGWQKSSYDAWNGGIIRFDRRRLEPIEVVAQNLFAPHSVLVSYPFIYFCDSLKMNVSKVNIHSKEKSIVAQFYGFTRGLYLDGTILIIGQSKMRNLQYLNKAYTNISIDSGIHLYDLEFHVSKFIQLPVENVYSLAPLEL